MSEQENRAAREAELWRQIVDNFGERAQLDEPAEVAAPPPPAPAAYDDPDDDPDDERHDHDEPIWEREEHFVPPQPAAQPLPEPRRLIAWLGLLGVPLLTVVLTFLSWTVPGWMGLILLAWFLGGFGYLVAHMRRHDDGFDDGARL